MPAVLQTLRGQLLRLVSEYHDAHPLETGISREEVRERLSRRATAALFDDLVDTLVGEGAVVATDHLALSSHRIAISSDEATLKDRLAELFRGAGLSPPDMAEAATSAGGTFEQAGRMLKLLIREATLVRVEALVFHRDTLEQLKDDVRRLKAGATDPVEIDVKAFKERFAVTRKYAIPLLGYLDQQRVTRRVGNARRVL
jgi:selenocysteine-specific elongation factor